MTDGLLLSENARDLLWIDLLAPCNSKADWHMNIMSVPASHSHSCFAGHSGMNSVLGQLRAIDAVVRISAYSSNHVARIDIFEPDFKRPVLKVFLEDPLVAAQCP